MTSTLEFKPIDLKDFAIIPILTEYIDSQNISAKVKRLYIKQLKRIEEGNLVSLLNLAEVVSLQDRRIVYLFIEFPILNKIELYKCGIQCYLAVDAGDYIALQHEVKSKTMWVLRIFAKAYVDEIITMGKDQTFVIDRNRLSEIRVLTIEESPLNEENGN